MIVFGEDALLVVCFFFFPTFTFTLADQPVLNFLKQFLASPKQ